MKEEVESKSVSELIKELKEIKDKFGDVSLNFCKCKMLSLAEEGQIGLKQAYLAGLKEGAERYKTKWHDVLKEKPIKKGLYLCWRVWMANLMYELIYWSGDYWVTGGNVEDKIIAWCELPTYTEEE